MNEKQANDAKMTLFDSVKTKLIIIMMLIAAVPLMVAVIISYITSTNKAKADAMDNLASQASFLQAEVSNTFTKTETALEAFASSPATIDYLKGNTSIQADLKKQMQTINESFGDSNNIVLSNVSGQMLLRSDDSKLSDISERTYFQKALAGEKNVSDIFVSASTNSRDICYAVPVRIPLQAKLSVLYIVVIV